MPDNDERLQQYLSQIEAGIPKEKVLASLKEGEQELVALIKLADAMRTLSHPMPSQAYTRAAKQKILSAVPQRSPRQKAKDRFQLGWVLFPSLTGAVAVFLVLFITLATLGIWLAGPASADVAMIQDVQGLVEVADNGDAIAWAPLSEGEAVRSGQQIRTAESSSASMVFSDGSRASLEPETTVLLKEVDGTWSGDLQVEIEQTIGKTSHKVVPLHSPTAFYNVHTPAGLASVRGTSFVVDVKANGIARVIVDSGEVAVITSADEINVPAGQATLIQDGKPPQEPGNFFSIADYVVSIDGLQWAVSGQRFRISDQTSISGAPAIGQALKIEGRILSTGVWVADSIGPVDTTTRSTFTGVIESIIDNRWLVGGRNVHISEITTLDPELAVGDSVEVTYLPLNESNWLATNVTALEQTAAEEPVEPVEPAPTSTVQATISTVPTLSAEAAEAACASSEIDEAFTTFAGMIIADAAEVKELFCNGLSFEEIEMANQLSLKHAWSLTEIGYMRLSEMSWEEIGAVALLFQTPGVTAGSTMCTGTENNPRAEYLAEKYETDYDEVNALFCEGGYNFGSIQLALKFAWDFNHANPSGNQIKAQLFLDQRYTDGMSWGQIKKALKDANPAEAPGKPEDKEKPDKPDKPEKPDKSGEDTPEEKIPPGQTKKDN